MSRGPKSTARASARTSSNEEGPGPSVYVIVWAFQVKPGSEAAFERMYGPDGDWAKFFRGDPKFRGTVLLRDAGRPGWYVTIDTWASREAYDTFRAWNRAEYAALDGRGKGLTLEETAISAGESVAGGA